MKKALVLLLALLFCKALAKPAADNAKEKDDDDTLTFDEAADQLNSLADSDGDADEDAATVDRDDDLQDVDEDEDTDDLDDEDDEDMGEASLPTTDWEKEVLDNFNTKWNEAMKEAEDAGEGNDDESIWAREIDDDNTAQAEPETTKVELTDDVDSNQEQLNDVFLNALNSLATEDDDADEEAQPIENEDEDNDDDLVTEDMDNSDDEATNDNDEGDDEVADDDQAQDGDKVANDDQTQDSDEDSVDGDVDESAPLEDELNSEETNADNDDDVDNDQDEAASELEDIEK